MESLGGANAQEILLIGDVSKVFADSGSLDKSNCQVRANILDGIDTAAKGDFKAIAVVISDISARLGAVLKALRENSRETRIILLAQMWEEPLARKQLFASSNGAATADDYLICPIQAKQLHELVMPRAAEATVRPGTAVSLDAAAEAKIKELTRLATEDELTGLKNRRYLWEFSRQIIDYAKKNNGRVMLLVFDIDDLKHYNDVYGHLAGDEILKQAAYLICRCCRKHDVVGRIGGDEFAVIFWDGPDKVPVKEESERRCLQAEHPKEAIFIAKRFINELERAESDLLGPSGKGVLTISGGLASFPRDGATIEQLFQQADKALLDAKRSGKNRIYLVGKSQSDIVNIE